MIKTFESFNDSDKELKKLLSHLISVIKEFGYREENYVDRQTWETEFHTDEKYSFCIKLRRNYFNHNKIDLDLINSLILPKRYAQRNYLKNDDIFFDIISEYLKTIPEIKFINQEPSVVITSEKSGAKFLYSIKKSDVDKVIKQISKESIELNISGLKYNL
jgi:hypothetical protein